MEYFTIFGLTNKYHFCYTYLPPVGCIGLLLLPLKKFYAMFENPF
jgi:hypothetical protein